MTRKLWAAFIIRACWLTTWLVFLFFLANTKPDAYKQHVDGCLFGKGSPAGTQLVNQEVWQQQRGGCCSGSQGKTGRWGIQKTKTYSNTQKQAVVGTECLTYTKIAPQTEEKGETGKLKVTQLSTIQPQTLPKLWRELNPKCTHSLVPLQ